MTQTILAKPYQSNGNLLTPGLWRALEPLRDRPEPRRALATSKYLSFLTYRDRSASQEVGLTSIVERLSTNCLVRTSVFSTLRLYAAISCSIWTWLTL